MANAADGAAALLSAVAPNVCAAVAFESTRPGTPVVTWGCDSTLAARRYALQTSGALTTFDGSMCLDVMPPKAQGAQVVVWGCAPTEATQHWTRTAAGELTNVQGLCLTIAYEDAQPGRGLVLWPCNGGPAQKWTFASSAAQAVAPTVTSTGSGLVSPSSVGGTAELPRVYLNTAMPAPTGRTISVDAGGDLQAALDAAQPGDVVALTPGATFVGNYVLNPKPGIGAGQWVTVRTAGQLPAEGTRVGLGDAGQMPKILTPNAAPALATAPGAQGWRLTGLEVSTTPTLPLTYTLVSFGTAGSAQQTTAQIPSRLVLDRSYVHGSSTLDLRRCVTLNSASTAIIDSYVSDCHSRNGDSQAVWGWNGPGPFKITNNHLEGGHEGLGFGGGDPSVPGLIPSDIEIRRNHVYRPPSWRGVWGAKNLFELKTGQRLLVEANVFENNWADAQTGFALVWSSTNQDGGCTWCATSDVTFRYNVVRNVAGGFNVFTLGAGTTGAVNPAVPLQRVTIAHNVITGLDGSNGRLYQVLGSVAGLTIANNSGLGVYHDVLFATPDQPLPDFVFRNNVTGSQYTLYSSVGPGTQTLTALQIPAANIVGNVIASGQGAWAVPAGNTYAPSVAAVAFVNLAGGDLTLAPSSPYLTGGTAGSRPGADVSSVNSMTSGVVR